MNSRRLQPLLAQQLLIIILLASPLAGAQHGWDEVGEEWVVLQGVVINVLPGKRYSELLLLEDEQLWFVELGPPWRNERAGLDEGQLSVWDRVTLYGYTAPGRKHWLKAVRVTLDGRNHDLYPNHVSFNEPVEAKASSAD